MSKELIENLRDYAYIAEAGEKSHWAKAMRQAAEYIMADLEKTLPEPFTYIVPSAFEKLSSGYAMSVFCAKQAINKSDIPLYAEPPARKPLTDEQIHDLWDIANGNLHKFTRAIEAAHDIKGRE